MEQGTGSGVAKITHESKKHKIIEGSWIVKAKEKGTVVKQDAEGAPGQSPDIMICTTPWTRCCT